MTQQDSANAGDAVLRSPLDAESIGPELLARLVEAVSGVGVRAEQSAPLVELVERLCEGLREVLDADAAMICVPGSGEELIAVHLVRGASVARVQAGALDESTMHRRPIKTASGELGYLAWSHDDGRDPDETIEWAAERFAQLAAMNVESHLLRSSRLDAIATERESLAGEIHDDSIQAMTVVSLRLQRLAMNLASNDEDRAAVDALRQLTDQAIHRLRHLLFSLHPSSLDTEGLAVSLEIYCETFVEPDGIGWQVHGASDADLRSEVASVGFRLARDAIFNAVKHAEPSKVDVEMAEEGAMFRVTVSDDGTGFDVRETSTPTPGHFGISHARALAEWVGGAYSVDSGIGSGTRVFIDLPNR